jgi:restriction system protein
MPMPGYQSIMLPLLSLLSDSREHSHRNVIEELTKTFQLTHEEQKELLPSGRQAVFDNRVGWARTYLKKAGLIDSPRRGIHKISKKGLKVLATKPNNIDVKFLEQFPEFIEFRATKKETGELEEQAQESNTQTPEEMLEYSYQKIRKALAQDLLNKAVSLPPSFFEKLVVELLVKMGYGGSIKDAGRAIGKSNDEGIDGTIKEDKLGLGIVYVQAKRWQPGNIVGRPEIHKFVGALAGQGAKKGIFITTSSFTKDAKEYVPKNETKIALIDGEQLTQLMIDYDLGVSLTAKYEIKRIDNDYFGEE